MLSLFALVFALINVDAVGISRKFKSGTPVKRISAFLMFFATFVGSLWLSFYLAFLFTGQVPKPILDANAQTGVVFATDLSLLVPVLVFSAILLWQRQPWGYVLTGILLIKCVTYALSLTSMSIFAAAAGVPGAWDLEPLWVFLGILCLIASFFFFRNLQFIDKKTGYHPSESDLPSLTKNFK